MLFNLPLINLFNLPQKYPNKPVRHVPKSLETCYTWNQSKTEGLSHIETLFDLSFIHSRNMLYMYTFIHIYKISCNHFRNPLYVLWNQWRTCYSSPLFSLILYGIRNLIMKLFVVCLQHFCLFNHEFKKFRSFSTLSYFSCNPGHIPSSHRMIRLIGCLPYAHRVQLY